MDSKKPLISIITATYNSALVVEECINSISEQTYDNIEYIIIDGGSKDQTVDIINRNKHVVDKFISEKDNGIYDAWNKGIKMATGDWITFIGSDDKFYPDAIQNYVDFINSRSDEYDFISSKMDLINAQGKMYRVVGKEWRWAEFSRANTIAHPGSLHNKKLFKNHGLYNDEYKICGDYELLLRPGKNLKTGFLDKITVSMADGGTSATHKVFKEHYRAVTETGKLNIITASYDYIKLNLKLFVRKLVLKIKPNFFIEHNSN